MNVQPASLGAVVLSQMLEGNHAVRQALELEVAFRRRLVVEQQHGALARREVLLQRQDLPPEPERVAGEQPHFGERVEHDERRASPLDRGKDRVHRLLQFDLGRVEERVPFLRSTHIVGGQLEHLDAVQFPTVRGGDLRKLRPAFRERDIEALHALLRPGEQKLERQGRLSRPGLAGDEVEVLCRQPAAEDLIEARDPGTCPRHGWRNDPLRALRCGTHTIPADWVDVLAPAGAGMAWPTGRSIREAFAGDMPGGGHTHPRPSMD